MTRPMPPLRQKLREMAVETMLDSAERCMIRDGYEKTTMQQIADDAGCAIGTLYIHFKSKDELLKAILARRSQVMFAYLLEAMSSTTDPLLKIRESIGAFLVYANQERDFFRLLLTAVPTRHRQMQKHIGEEAWRAHESHARREIEAIRLGQQSGQIRDDLPAEYIEDCIMALCMNNLEHFMSVSNPPPVDQQVDMVWQVITGGIRAKA